MTASDHLFISYASQDVALAEWLAERLTLAGYAVWFDLWKLLGGEDWSREITRVLNNEAVRILHLVPPTPVNDSYAAPAARDTERQRSW